MALLPLPARWGSARSSVALLPRDATGTWTSVFGVAVAADPLAAVLALAALKPLRARYDLGSA